MSKRQCCVKSLDNTEEDTFSNLIVEGDAIISGANSVEKFVVEDSVGLNVLVVDTLNKFVRVDEITSTLQVYKVSFIRQGGGYQGVIQYDASNDLNFVNSSPGRDLGLSVSSNGTVVVRPQAASITDINFDVDVGNGATFDNVFHIDESVATFNVPTQLDYQAGLSQLAFQRLLTSSYSMNMFFDSNNDFHISDTSGGSYIFLENNVSGLGFGGVVCRPQNPVNVKTNFDVEVGDGVSAYETLFHIDEAASQLNVPLVIGGDDDAVKFLIEDSDNDPMLTVDTATKTVTTGDNTTLRVDVISLKDGAGAYNGQLKYTGNDLELNQFKAGGFINLRTNAGFVLQPNNATLTTTDFDINVGNGATFDNIFHIDEAASQLNVPITITDDLFVEGNVKIINTGDPFKFRVDNVANDAVLNVDTNTSTTFIKTLEVGSNIFSISTGTVAFGGTDNLLKFRVENLATDVLFAVNTLNSRIEINAVCVIDADLGTRGAVLVGGVGFGNDVRKFRVEDNAGDFAFNVNNGDRLTSCWDCECENDLFVNSTTLIQGTNNVSKLKVEDDAGSPVTVFNVNTSTSLVTATNLECTEGFKTRARTAASGCTLTVNDYFFDVTGDVNSVVNLPVVNSVSKGVHYVIYKSGASPFTVTITPNGVDTIQGIATYVLNTINTSVHIFCDGVSNWVVLGSG
jgi:hypothetical protein